MGLRSFIRSGKCRFSNRTALAMMALMFVIGISHSAIAGYKTIDVPSASDMVYDDTTHILYVTSGDKIQRYNTVTESLLSPFQIGGNLRGIDLSPDGKTLAVADLSYEGNEYTGTAWIQLVDTQTGQSTKVTYSRESGEGGSYSVAYGSDGKLLFSGHFLGSGSTPLRKYDPVSGSLTTLLSLIWQDDMLSASADRSVIAWEEGDISSGPFCRYRVSDGNIIHNGTNWYNYTVAANRNGTQYAVLFGGVAFYDAQMNRIGEIMQTSSHDGPCSAVYDPVKDIVYFSWLDTSKVYAYNTATLTKIGEYDFGSKFYNRQAYGIGRLKISQDGSLLFAIVNGVSYIRLNNKVPSGDPISVTTSENKSVNVKLNGSDPDGDKITYAITNNPTHGQLSGTAPNLVYTPTQKYCGSDSFAYKLSDGYSESDPITVTVSVVTTQPVANPQSININEDDVVNITLSGSDIDGDSLTYAVASEPSHGTLTGTAPNLVYTADIAFTGNDSFTFCVNDGYIDSSHATVNIEVAPVPNVSIGTAKTMSLGSLVLISDAVVTAPKLETGVYFIESADRSSGIKLLTTTDLKVGQVVRFKAITGQVNGEWQLSDCTFSKITDGDSLKPVYLGSKAICNDRLESLNYTGIDSTGLLVRTYGKVTAVISLIRAVYITDGFQSSDGTGTWTGLSVYFPKGVTLPAVGDKIVVTGIHRVAKSTLSQPRNVNGELLPKGTVVYAPSLWTRGSSDLQKL